MAKESESSEAQKEQARVKAHQELAEKNRQREEARREAHRKAGASAENLIVHGPATR